MLKFTRTESYQGGVTHLILPDDDLLKKVDKRLKLKGGLKKAVRISYVLTLEERVNAKISVITRRVKDLLRMYPSSFKFDIVIFDNKNSVRQIYQQLYNVEFNRRGFYAINKESVFISGADITTKMLAHEITHAIVTKYCTKRIAPVPQEVWARWVEKELFR